MALMVHITTSSIIVGGMLIIAFFGLLPSKFDLHTMASPSNNSGQIIGNQGQS